MSTKLQSILLGGVVLGVAIPLVLVSIVPVLGVCLCCLAFIGAGVLTTYHYTDTNSLTITGGEGAGMGAGAGAIAGLVATFVTLLLMGFGIVPDAGEELVRQMERVGVFDQMDRDMEDQWTSMIKSLFVPVLVVPVQATVNVIGGALLSLIGGVIGASLFKKGNGSGPESPDYEVLN